MILLWFLTTFLLVSCLKYGLDKLVDAEALRAEMRASRAEAARYRKMIDDWNATANSQSRANMRTHEAKYQPPQYWRTLGIQPTRDKAVIMKAFRKRAAETHPDRGGNAGQFQAVFEARNAALREIGA